MTQPSNPTQSRPSPDQTGPSPAQASPVEKEAGIVDANGRTVTPAGAFSMVVILFVALGALLLFIFGAVFLTNYPDTPVAPSSTQPNVMQQ